MRYSDSGLKSFFFTFCLFLYIIKACNLVHLCILPLSVQNNKITNILTSFPSFFLKNRKLSHLLLRKKHKTFCDNEKNGMFAFQQCFPSQHPFPDPLSCLKYCILIQLLDAALFFCHYAERFFFFSSVLASPEFCNNYFRA